MNKLPHGYMPFLVLCNTAIDDVDRHELWTVATPFCDSADDLCYPTYNDNMKMVSLRTNEGDWYADHRRILRLFDNRDDAVTAAWNHAKRWWDGEPIKVPAIMDLKPLPEGYAIWIDVGQREV